MRPCYFLPGRSIAVRQTADPAPHWNWWTSTAPTGCLPPKPWQKRNQPKEKSESHFGIAWIKFRWRALFRRKRVNRSTGESSPHPRLNQIMTNPVIRFIRSNNNAIFWCIAQSINQSTKTKDTHPINQSTSQSNTKNTHPINQSTGQWKTKKYFQSINQLTKNKKFTCNGMMTEVKSINCPGDKVDRPWRFLYSEGCVIFWTAVQSSLEILTVERIFSSSPKSVKIIVIMTEWIQLWSVVKNETVIRW